MHMLRVAHDMRAWHHGGIAMVVMMMVLPFFKVGGD
jgi:hypothetical protein